MSADGETPRTERKEENHSGQNNVDDGKDHDLKVVDREGVRRD